MAETKNEIYFKPKINNKFYIPFFIVTAFSLYLFIWYSFIYGIVIAGIALIGSIASYISILTQKISLTDSAITFSNLFKKSKIEYSDIRILQNYTAGKI